MLFKRKEAGTINLIMAEFGTQRKNAGGGELPYQRLNPTLDSFSKYFSDSKITLFTDSEEIVDIYSNCKIDIKLVNPPFDRNSERYGWRCNDYYKFYGLLNSDKDISIAMDSDMLVVSENVKNIIEFTRKFGLCFPANPRLLTKIDIEKGIDPGKLDQKTIPMNYGFAYNISPVSFDRNNSRAKMLLERICDIFKKNPSRSNTIIARAIWDTGIFPYILPFQWCVCKSHVGCGNEIILHVGHKEVKDYYL